jgi:quinoprotein glucose dehydrogenase
MYVFDRVTGEPIWPIEERPVPQSTAEGEETSPTQPFPTKPAAFELQGSFEKDVIDFTPELNKQGLEILAGYRHGPLFTPPAEDKPTIYNPGWGGGGNWMGVGIDLETGIAYVPSQQGPISIQLQRPDAARSNFRFMGANNPVRGPAGLPLFKPPYGRVTAIDLKTGNNVWMQPIGDGPIDNEALKDVDMKAYLKKAGLPRLGDAAREHPLVTKTLLFLAEGAAGRSARGGAASKPNFRALDKATGEIVAEITLPQGPSGTPMTYMAGGKQYITVATGGAGSPSKLYTLALPDKAAKN